MMNEDFTEEKKEILNKVSQKKSIESEMKQYYLEGYRDGAEDALDKIDEYSREEFESLDQETTRQGDGEELSETESMEFEAGDRVKLSEKGIENFKNVQKVDDPSEIEGTVKGVSNLGVRVNWDYLKGDSAYYHMEDELIRAEGHPCEVCGKKLDTEKGRRIHESLKHGEKKEDREKDKEKNVEDTSSRFNPGDRVELSEKGIENFLNPHDVSDVSEIEGEVQGVTEKGVRVNWDYLGSDTGYYHREDGLRKIEEGFTCEVCGKTVDTEAGKKIHKSRVHGSSEESPGDLTDDSTEKKILETMKEEDGVDGAVSVEKISSKLGMMAEKVFQFLRGMEKKNLVEKANVKGDIKRRYRIKTAETLGGNND